MTVNKVEISVNIAPSVQSLYRTLKSLPFYKVDTGYRFASYLLEDEEKSGSLCEFLKEPAPFGQEDVKKLFEEAIQNLSGIQVSDTALTNWVTFQKATEGVAEYHAILDGLWEQLHLVFFTKLAIKHAQETVPFPNTECKDIDCQKTRDYFGLPLYVWDMRQLWKKKRGGVKTDTDVVLNHNNPFADISIREQKFIYGAPLGRFESLEMMTSRNLTKIMKDTEKSYMSVQPGFKIKRCKSISGNISNEHGVVFDDTLTTEIAETDNNIYVYID